MPRLSDRGSFLELVLLNAVLATAAGLGRLPVLFYFISGLTNLILLTYMKSFRWWFGSPGTLTLRSGRALLISVATIWVLAGCIALALFDFPIL